MVSFQLILGVLFSSACVAEVALEDIYSTSADAIFYSHLAKLNRRAKPNAKQIGELLSNGSAVAGKVQDVFEKVYKLQEGPINVKDLIDVGKEAYTAGKEAYELGKQVYEVGKEVFSNGKELFSKNKALLQVGKTLGKTLGSIAKNLGPALGGIGIAFAFITMFLPKEDSPELLAIKNGFKEMHGRFDQVQRQIEQLEVKIDFYQAINPYKKVRDNLENVYRKYINLAEAPTSEGYKQAFQEACRDHSIEPLQALESLRRIIVNPGPEDQPHMLRSIIQHHKMDYKTIMGWFQRITHNAYTLGTLRSACFGSLHGSEDNARSHSLNQTEIWIKEIIAELSKYEEKFTNLDEEFVPILQKQLDEAVANARHDANAENQLNERCRVLEKQLTGTDHNCLGAAEVNTKRVAINNFLNTKYYWLNWLVVVYTQDEGNEDNPCNTKYGHHWIHTKGSQSDQRVFVSWSRRDIFQATELRTKAQGELKRLMSDFDANAADRWGTWFGTYGKYFIVYNNHVSNGITRWLNDQKYDNKFFCTFGGYTGYYYRSVVTSGVAAHIAQSAYRYIVDYVVGFY